MNEPFRATAIWTALLNHLQTNLLTKKYRHRLRSYEQSFTGTEAIDVVFKFLTDNSSTLLNNKKIDRNNALKICQVLIKENIFEPSNNKNAENFEDSTVKFYRFATTNKTETSRASSSLELALQTDEPKSTFSEHPMAVIENRYIESSRPFERFNKGTRSSLRRLKTNRVLNKLAGTSYLIKPNEETNNKDIQPESYELLEESYHSEKHCAIPLKRSWTVASLSTENLNKKQPVDHVREVVLKKLALARLLSQIEVPYLEDLLPLVNEETHFLNDVNEKTCLKENVYDDKWLSAAQMCIDLPLNSCRPLGSWSKKEWKKAAYNLVVKELRKNKEPLINPAMQTVFLQIFGLLKEDKVEIAVQVFQLACLILPRLHRSKLQEVLAFMSVVEQDHSINLNKKLSNRHVVLKDLVPVIINFPLLGAEQAFITTYFLFKQHSAIFTLPKELQSEVDRIVTLDEGEIHLAQGFYTCERILTDVYEKQKKHNTDISLRQLLEMKLKDLSLSSREKSKWLHKFHKSHLEIYDSYLKK